MIDSLESIITHSKGDTNKINTLNRLAWEIREYNPDKSLKYANEALQIAQKINFLSGEAYAYHHLGKHFELNFNYDTALLFYKKALPIFQKIGFNPDIINVNTCIGMMYAQKKMSDTALYYFENALRLAKNESDISSILNYIGVVYNRYHKNIPDSAIKYFSLSLKLAEKDGNIENVSGAAANLSITYNYLYQYRKALSILRSVFPLVEQSDLTIKKAAIYSQIALCYQNLDIPDSNIMFNLKALLILEHSKNFELLAYIYNNLGVCYYLKSIYDTSILYYKKALNITKNILKEKYSIAACISNIARVYELKGDLDSAMEACFEALKMFHNINDSIEIGNRYLDISNLYTNKKDYNKAIQYCELALLYSKNKNDKGLILRTLVKLGSLYKEINKDEKAFSYYIEALNIAPEMESKEGIRIFLENVAVNLFRIKNYNASLFCIQRALNISELMGSLDGKAHALLMIGKNYKELNKADSCIIYCQEALDLAKKIHNKELEYECFINLSNIYENINDYKKAVEYYRQYVEVKDSIVNEKTNNKISELEISYQTEKKDREIENLKKDQQIKDLEIQEKKQELQTQQLEQEKKQQAIQLLMASKKVQELSILKKQREIEDLQKDQQIKTLQIQQSQLEGDRQQKDIQLLVSSKKLQEAEIKKKQSEIDKRTWVFTISLFFIILLVASYVQYYRNRQEKDKVRTEKRLFKLEQKALQLQMNPHFIFNSLNSINHYIMSNQAYIAADYLAKFTRLMRLILEASAESFISLSMELEILQNYLALEQERYKNKFDCDIYIDPTIDTDNVMIPPMLIQPHIENAIIHGILPKKDKGNINIILHQESETKMKCIVKDNGIGRDISLKMKKSNAYKHKSMGMSITEERLKVLGELYADNLNIEIKDIQNEMQTGTEIILQIPTRNLS